MSCIATGESRCELAELRATHVALVVRDHLPADVVRTGVEMRADASGHVVDGSPHDACVDQPVTAPGGDVVVR
jgi:hypothetical protein